MKKSLAILAAMATLSSAYEYHGNSTSLKSGGMVMKKHMMMMMYAKGSSDMEEAPSNMTMPEMPSSKGKGSSSMPEKESKGSKMGSKGYPEAKGSMAPKETMAPKGYKTHEDLPPKKMMPKSESMSMKAMKEEMTKGSMPKEPKEKSAKGKGMATKMTMMMGAKGSGKGADAKGVDTETMAPTEEVHSNSTMP